MDSLLGRSFESYDQARQVISDTFTPLGYIVRHCPTPNYVEFCCSKGREVKSKANKEGSRRRNTSTQMAGCPFKHKARLYSTQAGERWVIETTRNELTRTHNHLPEVPGSSVQARAVLIEQLKSHIISLYNSGVRPVHILAEIRSQSHLDVQNLTRNDIYIFIRRHRLHELGGRTQMEWLYDQLQDNDDYYYRDRRDEANRITGLFLAPKTGIGLLNRYPSVDLMDCTYKTNRFNMPLFNICGATSTRKTFQVAAVFLNGETTQHYSWALEILDDLIDECKINRPQSSITDRALALLNALVSCPTTSAAAPIFCRWHVNMNVLAKCKRFFPPKARFNTTTQDMERAPLFAAFLKDWNSLIDSITEEEYETRLKKPQEGQPNQDPYPEQAIQYVTKTWLNPWKAKIVRCWVHRHLHFGHTTMSIVESLHSAMKKFIVSSVRRFDNRFWPTFAILDS